MGHGNRDLSLIVSLSLIVLGSWARGHDPVPNRRQVSEAQVGGELGTSHAWP